MTIINHSFLFDRNDEPISSCIPVLRRSQQTNRSKPLNNQTNSDSTQDYIYVDQNLLETANHIERILKFYRQDLKQESNTQLDCNQQLITRLIDFIRPTYSSNRDKLNDLDILFQEISTLHDVKLIEQKEKTEQLQTEIAHLKKLIITTADEDDSGNNTSTQIYRISEILSFIKNYFELNDFRFND
jgi:predicted RNase H-like nuclease (RuvC/YqgF family)